MLNGCHNFSVSDEFMAAIKLRWPTALVQFEDFQSKHAIKLLMRWLGWNWWSCPLQIQKGVPDVQ